jgi:dTMP kinase
MRLIIIDGLDGVGKDTQARQIKKRYEKSGENVKIRSHPESDNFFGKKAKKALLGKGKINKLKAAVFYMMDVLFSIRKYYRKNEYDTLIMVRYLVGTAYLPERFAKIAYDFFIKFVPTSKYMFFLDAEPNILLKRIKNRKEKEMFENLKEFENVRKKALYLVRNWNIIDISGSIDDSFSKINEILDDLDKKV